MPFNPLPPVAPPRRDHLGLLRPAFSKGPAAAEHRVARTLATLPAFAAWQHQAMPADLEQILPHLDQQQLMTLTAVCLLKLVHADAAAA